MGTQVPAFTVEHLTRRYPRMAQPANDDLSFEIAQGEFFGLLGDNGAGKTTLVKQLANLLSPSSGTVLLFGKPLNFTPSYATTRIGYMPQSGTALNNLTVAESFYFTAHLRGKTRSDARMERDSLLEKLSIGGQRDTPVSRLSGGQRRLVLLGTALAASPPVLILDEPTNDLDPQNRVRVWDIVSDTNRINGTTIILVTHNVLEAEKVIQRVAIMRQGRFAALGRPGVLKASLNARLRLDISFDPAQPPTFPDTITRADWYAPQPLAPGRWRLHLPHEAASALVGVLATYSGIEDFRLSTATLEDLYLAVTNEGDSRDDAAVFRPTA